MFNAFNLCTNKKKNHWNNILQSATEQSGRNNLATLITPYEFKKFVLKKPSNTHILLSPRGKNLLSNWASKNKPQELSLIVGPEGGFTIEEEDFAQKHNILMLSMGKRILRTETAGLNAIATINAFWDKNEISII